MPIPGALSRHMGDTVSIRQPTGRDSHDAPSWSAPTVYLCRVRRENKATKNAQGQDVVSTAQVILDRMIALDVRAEVTLPDGTKPPIINVISRSRSVVGSDLSYTEIQV